VTSETACGLLVAPLRRLVCFVASALDVPYAFIAGLAAPPGEGTVPCLTVWLARDFGLQFEFARLYGLAPSSPDYAEALRRIWPATPGLAPLAAACGPGLPLHDRRGELIGHLAALNPDPSRRKADQARLQPLAPVAAARLEWWANYRTGPGSGIVQR
jgi:hypothetical protein